jgi:energy-coupling factor transporter ATP-binding protein EcfA2
LLGAFNFKGADQQKKVGMLSGGERNRVHLAKMLKSGANVLLLDEPTNDLDVDTLRALEEALEDFAGCAVIISHDRWFLDRIATHMLAFEGDSHVEWFEGNFQDYEEDKKRRLIGCGAARSRAICCSGCPGLCGYCHRQRLRRHSPPGRVTRPARRARLSPAPGPAHRAAEDFCSSQRPSVSLKTMFAVACGKFKNKSRQDNGSEFGQILGLGGASVANLTIS